MINALPERKIGVKSVIPVSKTIIIEYRTSKDKARVGVFFFKKANGL